jgi:hypothetical protein
MRKGLLFFSGFITGIVTTILVVFLIYGVYQPNDDGVLGLTIFPEKGECVAIKSEMKVLQVIEPNMALAIASDYRDGIVVLFINYEGKPYYDEQKIEIPATKCARQIGTYQYTAKNGMDKTVPVVVIE